jgi:asparagine synthase (glutamine-hydrolysing)
MCGIAGIISRNGAAPDSRPVEQMLARLEPRGPDAEGIVKRPTAVLGHRRLKIIDLSDKAAQPMVDSDLSLTVVFNGCIYNYRDLRQELEQLGYCFFSNSDTEVIIKAYHAWKENCVDRFNGMFAFAIHNDDDGTVFIARDRLGIKPFYYHDRGDQFTFASSLPALLDSGIPERDLDPAGLHLYLSFHSVVPAPRTIVKSIRKLPPATRLTIYPDGRREQQRYWAPRFARGEAGLESFDDLREQVAEKLDRAVDRRMVADVPVGVLLSGGLDSSLVVGLLARAGVRDLNTFTIGFESVKGEEGNEFAYSDIVAQEFGTRHHKLEFDSRELVSHLPDCFAAMSEPMVSHDNIGFYLLSREVARHVKVVQSGQGADEVFGGYFWYPPLLTSSDPEADYAHAFRDRDHEEILATLGDAYHGDDASGEFLRDHFRDAQAETGVDKALHIDTTVMLVEDPVKRVDNMTMAWGLEARVPFLDHELVELAARVPPAMKVSEGGKYILKEVARKIIPAAVIDRPKGYFPVPELKYLRGPSLDFVRDALNARACRERGLLKRDRIDLLLDDPHAHLTPLKGSKLWQVASLEVWLQTHGL